ncbi:MAG: hypothetical protein WA089_15855, partial [Anaerolineae bacterium]
MQAPTLRYISLAEIVSRRHEDSRLVSRKSLIMGFVVDGLDSEAYDRNYTDRDLIRRIAAYFRPYARQMALIAAAITL